MSACTAWRSPCGRFERTIRIAIPFERERVTASPRRRLPDRDAAAARAPQRRQDRSCETMRRDLTHARARPRSETEGDRAGPSPGTARGRRRHRRRRGAAARAGAAGASCPCCRSRTRCSSRTCSRRCSSTPSARKQLIDAVLVGAGAADPVASRCKGAIEGSPRRDGRAPRRHRAAHREDAEVPRRLLPPARAGRGARAHRRVRTAEEPSCAPRSRCSRTPATADSVEATGAGAQRARPVRRARRGEPAALRRAPGAGA